ncbi:Mu transposase C-terminal domain-containing protein [Agromyces sp. NPDC058104]|uniref:Mu transposase C-terminal domain-containing protein n=1 Tax=Agromyces sp. NPDC058104 TaxID=3346342 RepID=UPI0036DE760E
MTGSQRLRIGDLLALDDGDYRVAGYANGVFTLRNTLTSEYTILDHIELARQLRADTPTENAPRESDTKLPIAVLVDHIDEQAQRLEPHIRELIDGTPAVGDVPREQYSPTLPMKSRLESKLLELHRIGIEMEIATLKRRIKRYKEAGPAGLVDRRTLRNEQPLARADERVIETLSALMTDAQEASTPTLTKLRANLAKELLIRYPGEKVPAPSVSSLRRYVSLLDGGRNILGSAVRRQSAMNVPKRAFSARTAAAPGQEVQIDSTMLDVFVRDDWGMPQRPTLTIMVDKATRSILGSSIRLGAATAHDHAVLLARCLVPKPLRPGPDYYAEHDLPELPWAAYLSPEQRREYDVRRPYIVPQRILTDNGSDFLAVSFRSACARYGISLTESAPGTPTDKAQVERAFGTIRTKFSQYLPGYTGGRTEHRGISPELDDDLLDVDMLDELFERWVAIVWQNRRHSGLIDPRYPAERHTPNTMYSALFELTGYFPVPLEETDYIELMPCEKRTIQSDGIELRSRMYDSPHLGPYRNRRDENGRAQLFDIHYDPNVAGRVWVRPDPNETWITCAWKEIDGLSRPHLAGTMRRAHRRTLEHGGFTDDQADDLTLGLIDDLQHEAAQRELQTLSEAAQARDLPSKSRTDIEDDIPEDDFTPLKTI